MSKWIVMWAVLLFVSSDAMTGTGGGLVVKHLRCEYRVEPRGIDTPRPRLSWRIEEEATATRGQVQTAYRVLVASCLDNLRQARGDLWDSGRVAGNESCGVEYGGAPLRSGVECFWMVRAWDMNGNATGWSEPARFTVGLLDPSDWQSAWIGYDAARDVSAGAPDLAGAKWIWHAADPPRNAPAQTRAFRAKRDLPADAKFDEAELLVTADDHLALFINGESVHLPAGESLSWEDLSVVSPGRLLRPGSNEIAIEAGNGSPGPAGLIVRLVVPRETGDPIVLVTDASWRSTAAPAEGWTAPGFDDSAWSAAAELADFGDEPWGDLRGQELVLPPPRYLRGEFTVRSELRRATLYASALGIYEAQINGRRIGDDWFTPGWTDYEKRVYYNTYDVTRKVREGANALGAILADGWYSGYVGYGRRRDHYGERTRFRAQLVLEYDDGTREVIGTGPGWRACTGPLLEADFLMGEVYDARREMEGWSRPGFDDSAWSPVDVTPAIDAAIQAYPADPVGVIGTFRPVEITEPRPGVRVLNLGQNFAGVVRLRVEGEAGREITLRFAERLNPDGTIYTANLRAARCTDRYVCRGDGVEEWTPRFTFHGFQYVEVTGLDGPLTSDTVVGLALGSRTPRVGRFECSDPMLNRLVSNIYWTQRANFLEVPTDCPQRDERLGWTGDAQVYIRTASYLCDVHAFFTKWLIDLADAQREDGQFPMVAPLKVAGADGGPAWADAGTICPWTMYWVYDDTNLLARHYDGMKRYVAFCVNRCTDDLRPPAEFHCFGDWLNIEDDTPRPVIFTAYFAYSTALTARAAAALGRDDEAARYHELFRRLRTVFNHAYVDAEGRIDGDSQTAYVLALAFDLVEGERREQAAAHLIRRIEARDGHLSTGFVGTKDLMLVLSKIGRDDVAYRLLHNDTFPSWGFTIRHGATSIWERWNGWTPEDGFNNPGMNSFAHYAFGAVGEWIFRTIGGIDTATPGFRDIVIRPRPGGELTRAKTSYDSIHGTIATHWELDGDELRLEVTIPPNTTALIHVPARAETQVMESGRPAADAAGLEPAGRADGAALFRAQAGQYRFLSSIRHH
ncbi:MAG: family 78 glycoside hydrolase catalytic domain [Planctomycetota bacterium]|nr:family 78 glycoside hydrolase catalytic domain [Planctomycetota bacterium]